MLAAVCLSQTPMQVQIPGVRRVGDRLACKCGTCNNTVGNCPMLECHYSHPARQRISKMLDQGMSDDAIVAVFVKEQGLSALAAPPTEGFSLLGWLMPFIALALGLGVIWLYIKRFRKPVEALAPAARTGRRSAISRTDREGNVGRVMFAATAALLIAAILVFLFLVRQKDLPEAAPALPYAPPGGPQGRHLRQPPRPAVRVSRRQALGCRLSDDQDRPAGGTRDHPGGDRPYQRRAAGCRPKPLPPAARSLLRRPPWSAPTAGRNSSRH